MKNSLISLLFIFFASFLAAQDLQKDSLFVIENGDGTFKSGRYMAFSDRSEKVEYSPLSNSEKAGAYFVGTISQMMSTMSGQMDAVRLYSDRVTDIINSNSQLQGVLGFSVLDSISTILIPKLYKDTFQIGGADIVFRKSKGGTIWITSTDSGDADVVGAMIRLHDFNGSRISEYWSNGDGFFSVSSGGTISKGDRLGFFNHGASTNELQLQWNKNPHILYDLSNRITTADINTSRLYKKQDSGVVMLLPNGVMSAGGVKYKYSTKSKSWVQVK